MKHIAKHIIILVLGFVLTVFSLFDMVKEEDEDVLHIGDAQDSSSFLYLFVGVIMVTAGIVGIVRDQKKNPRRRY
jgi:hypothetical protein